MIDDETWEVVRTLLQWQERGLIKTAVQIRAPAGHIAQEYVRISDIPKSITNPRTGESFDVCLKHVEVVYRLVPVSQREVARAACKADTGR